MKSPVLRYLIYSVVITLYLYLSFQVLSDMDRTVSETYEGIGTVILVSILLHVGFGLLLGADRFLEEWTKDGSWQIRLPKLIAFVLPFFVLTLIPILVISGVNLPLPTLLPFLTSTMGSLAQVALGYGILSCFYRE